MQKHIIYKWADIWAEIKNYSTRKLLLGNGASIAVCDNFAYGSLYEEADKAGKIGESLKRIFDDFETTDFEYILRLLWVTKKINKLLGVENDDTSRLYIELQRTLIKTITNIHPNHEDIKR